MATLLLYIQTVRVVGTNLQRNVARFCKDPGCQSHCAGVGRAAFARRQGRLQTRPFFRAVKSELYKSFALRIYKQVK